MEVRLGEFHCNDCKPFIGVSQHNMNVRRQDQAELVNFDFDPQTQMPIRTQQLPRVMPHKIEGLSFGNLRSERQKHENVEEEQEDQF